MGKDNPNPHQKHHHQRKQYNNNNPYNKLSLNKYHQIDKKQKVTQSNKLHKKKRDLQRLIKFKQQKQQQIDNNVLENLEKIKKQLQGNKKKYQQNKRKEFFIHSKYKQIMEIQMRKIVKKIKQLQQIQSPSQQNKKQLSQWSKKQRYIKYYPKNLKYVSLFPSNKSLQPGAIEFQQKIMNDIQQKYLKQLNKRNQYISENIKIQKKDNNKIMVKDIKNMRNNNNNKKVVDNFFIQDHPEHQEEEQQRQEQEQIEQQEQREQEEQEQDEENQEQEIEEQSQ